MHLAHDQDLAKEAKIAPTIHRENERAALTQREAEVLRLIGDGMKNRDIAEALVISEVTVKVHVQHIFEKLGVRTRTQAALAARRLI